jgi:site-specific DNA-methyltransferase (adenine-specific)
MVKIKIPPTLERNLLPLIQVKPYWRNPRKNAPAVAAVKASILKYGFNVPLGIDTENTIITGHTRYLAARDLGMKEIPCIILDHLTPPQVKEYRIADNRTSELSEWDNPKLLEELREFDNLPSFTDVFFKGDSIEKMLNDPLFDEKSFEHGITKDKIDKTDAKIRVSFEARVKDTVNDQVSIICPQCTYEFHVSIKELESERKVMHTLAEQL